MFFFSGKNPVIDDMQKTLNKLKSKDPDFLHALDADKKSILADFSPEERRQRAIMELENAISHANTEPEPMDHTFHSRDPLTGITQTHLASKNVSLAEQFEDNVIPEVQAFGQGNPIVWIPTGIDGVLEQL